MSRQSISFTSPKTEWVDRKVNVEYDYKSNNEAVNDLVRKAREIEAIRARSIEAEQSGFTEMGREAIRAEIHKQLGAVANHGLSENTREDLQRIYRRCVREYGEDQANRYFDALL